MKRNIIAFTLLLQLLSFIICLNIENIEDLEKKFQKEYEKEFKKKVKKFITNKKLDQKDKKVTKNIFKRLFKDLMMEGVESAFASFSTLYDKVAESLAEEAFPEGVEYIQSNEIEKYLDYEKIMEKFAKYGNDDYFNKEL